MKPFNCPAREGDAPLYVLPPAAFSSGFPNSSPSLTCGQSPRLGIASSCNWADNHNMARVSSLAVRLILLSVSLSNVASSHTCFFAVLPRACNRPYKPRFRAWSSNL